MTCKDCFYCACCDKSVPHRDYKMTAEICMTYKDKSKIIELPCKFGDTVYYIGGIHNTLIKSAKVEEIYYNGDSFAFRLCSENDLYFDVQQEEIYFTCEEAEKTLRENNEKTNK